MNEPFRATRLTDSIYWVGAIDWNLRDFHGYLTSRGTTYNAYLVVADKIALIDTVKAPFRSEMLARIASVIDPRDISFIISNHSELDHSGCLMDMIDLAKPEAVYASTMGVKALQDHFHHDPGLQAVKEGQSVSLGNMTLAFAETRMMHWPDSMFTYVPEAEVLFSQDAFGMHLASFERFDDELSREITDYETAKYFANILMPFASRVRKNLERLDASGWLPRLIAPDHGPVWRSGTSEIRRKYLVWAERKPARKAVVVFDTMWQSTEKLAKAICDGLLEGGAHVKFMPLRTAHRSDVATELLDAGALLVGSPTLNDGLFPTVADVLTYVKGLKPQKLIGAVFGSYGWSSTGLDEAVRYLTEMNVELVGEPLKVKYVPDAAALQSAYELGRNVAARLTAQAAIPA